MVVPKKKEKKARADSVERESPPPGKRADFQAYIQVNEKKRSDAPSAKKVRVSGAPAT